VWSITKDAHIILIVHFLCISTVHRSLINNHTLLFVPLQDFSVQADFFRQDEITVRIRTDHCNCPTQEPVVEKTLGENAGNYKKKKGWLT